MTKQAIITVGLGFGDESKGASVDALCRQYSASLVVRYSGGCQSGHNVELPDGRRHTFSQFGAGTLCGVPTYLGQQMIVDPLAMVREAAHLVELTGESPFNKLTVHPKCLVTTQYTRQMNRWKCRHANHSCGHGIGETRDYWLKYGNDSILWEDLGFDRLDVLEDKLELQRQRLLNTLRDASDRMAVEFESSRFVASRVVRAELFESAVSRICNWDGTAVFEGSQGILIDETHGLGDERYRTFSDVTPHHALELCRGVPTCVVGITRSYMTRHGDGPFPCKPLTGPHVDLGNPANEWQGAIRFGEMSFDLLKYAAGVAKPDMLMVSHLDQCETDMDQMASIAPLLAVSRGPTHEDRSFLADPLFR